MINIGTVWTGDKFEQRYLWNLYAMLSRNITEPFLFFVISDKEPTSEFNEQKFPNIRVIPAEPGVWGWWHYMKFYSGLLPTPLVYFGLDTVIRGDITSYVKRKTLTMSRDFNYLIGNRNPALADTYADCAAVIPEGGLPWIYDKFCHQHACLGLGKDASVLMHVWMTKQFRMYQIKPDIWQDEVPNLMTSYKWPTPKLVEPEEPMVFWHGQPQIHECLNRAEWIKKHWHSEDLQVG